MKKKNAHFISDNNISMHIKRKRNTKITKKKILSSHTIHVGSFWYVIIY